MILKGTNLAYGELYQKDAIGPVVFNGGSPNGKFEQPFYINNFDIDCPVTKCELFDNHGCSGNKRTIDSTPLFYMEEVSPWTVWSDVHTKNGH